MKAKCMKKLIFAAVVCASALGCLLGIRAPYASAAAETKSYQTGTIISYQGQNNFYYAWGTPEHYVLMEYGPVWGGNSDGWHGVEGYQTVSGSTLHPGNYWGVMVIWVADASGKVSLDGMMQKGASNGDGATLGIYHQTFGGELSTIFEKFTRDMENFEVTQELTVAKGDSLIFYCDSGIAKDNNSDSCGCPFTITYTQRGDDAAEGEDLSVYLSDGRPGDIGGFEHVEQEFAAEVLDGTLTEKTVATSEGCSSAISAPGLLGMSVIALVMIRRKRK